MIQFGITGTRKGTSAIQLERAVHLIRDRVPVDTAFLFHHGDCVGADAEMHTMLRQQLVTGLPVIHPASDSSLRAFCDPAGGEQRTPKPYLDRNRDIVDASDFLIALPWEPTEQARGGTWYTVRYARQQRKPVLIVWRNGAVTEDA